MDRTPAGISPDEPHALVISKPGYDTIRFGPLPGITAGAWAATLRARLHQAPDGTTVEVVSFQPGAGSFIDPDSIPRSTDELDGPFRADPGHPANGGFPDLHDRLVLLHGETRAAQMWEEACRRAEAETAYDEASQAAAADRAEAAGLLDRARELAEQAGQKIISLSGAAAAWDFDAVPGGHGDDAQHHAETAARELRAAARALRSAGEVTPC